MKTFIYKGFVININIGRFACTANVLDANGKKLTDFKEWTMGICKFKAMQYIDRNLTDLAQSKD